MQTDWCHVAELRKNQIEKGTDITFCDVFVPYYRALVENKKPKSLIEIGSGTGHMCKSICAIVDSCTAIEPSKEMNEVAKSILPTNVTLFEGHFEEYSSDRKFDLAISHMCVQAIADVNKFLLFVEAHLQPNGVLCFSIPHPCFYNDYKMLIPADRYSYMTDSECKVTFSITTDSENKITNVPYFHRPISQYFNLITDAKLKIVNFEEIYPEAVIQMRYGKQWKAPRYCVFHCAKN